MLVVADCAHAEHPFEVQQIMLFPQSGRPGAAITSNNGSFRPRTPEPEDGVSDLQIDLQ